MKITLELVEQLMAEAMVMWSKVIPEDAIKKSDVFKYKAVLDTRCTNRAGQCRWDRKEIGISPNCIQNHSMMNLKNTIAHELLHAIFEYEGHGKRWKLYAEKFNRTEFAQEYGKITRCYNMSDEQIIATSKYKLICPDCGHVSYRGRKTRYMNLHRGTTYYTHKGCENYMTVEQIK